MTVPGPFTMSQQAQNDHYPDAESAAMAYAAAVNAEIKDLHAAGADIVQIDEPYMQARPDAARAYGLAALKPHSTASPVRRPSTSASGTPRSSTSGPRATRSCPSWPAARPTRSRSRPRSRGSTSACWPTSAGKTIILGVIDLSDHEVETAETVADRVRRAFPYTSPEQITIATDCGMKYLPRASAEGKMRAMAGAAAILRAEL